MAGAAYLYIECVQANICLPAHAPQAPSSHLASSPKHTDQAGQRGSKQTHRHMARQGYPAHQQGLTTQKHQDPAFSHPHTAHNNSLCGNPQPPAEVHTLPGSLHKSLGWAEEADPSRKGYHIQGPPDASKQSKRAHARAWDCGPGTIPPHRAPPMLRAGEGLLPLPTMCVGQSRARRHTATTHPQPHSSLNSQPCAEGQLNSSIAVISRHLTPLNRSPAAEGPLPGRSGPVGSHFLWLVLSAPILLSSLWVCWSLTRGSSCEHQPDPQLSGSGAHMLLTDPKAAPVNYPTPSAWCFCPLQVYKTRSAKVSFPGWDLLPTLSPRQNLQAVGTSPFTPKEGKRLTWAGRLAHTLVVVTTGPQQIKWVNQYYLSNFTARRKGVPKWTFWYNLVASSTCVWQTALSPRGC